MSTLGRDDKSFITHFTGVPAVHPLRMTAEFIAHFTGNLPLTRS